MGRHHSFTAGGIRWWVRSGADPTHVRRLVESTLDAMARGETHNIKSGRRKQLFPLRLSGKPEIDHLLKINRYPKGWHPLRDLRGSKARAELRRAEKTAARGVATPVPLAAGERRLSGRLERCFLLSAMVPDAIDLRELWFRGLLSGAERRALLPALGRFTREVQEAGIFQEDYAPNNILVQRGEPPKFLLIDYERARIRRRVGEANRTLMLAKLERALFDASCADRLRFLQGYGGSAESGRAWWRRLEAYLGQLARRDLARMRRSSTRRGRRFSPVEIEGWSGFVRRGVDATELLHSVEACGRTPIRTETSRWIIRYPDARPSEIWAVANTLWTRRLTARPLAILERGTVAYLILERAANAVMPMALEPVTVLLDRLLALGEPLPEIDSQSIAVLAQRGGRRAVLLTPGEAHFGRGIAPERHRRARAMASQLTRESLESR